MPTRKMSAPAARPPAVAIAREWGDVHVGPVDLFVEREESGTARARVRACIGLGSRLLPADVRVELVTGAEPGADAAPLRLWSSRSYHNGRYLFEAQAPAEHLECAGDLSVCVVPSGAGEADVEPVIAEIAWPDDRNSAG